VDNICVQVKKRTGSDRDPFQFTSGICLLKSLLVSAQSRKFIVAILTSSQYNINHHVFGSDDFFVIIYLFNNFFTSSLLKLVMIFKDGNDDICRKRSSDQNGSLENGKLSISSLHCIVSY